MLNVMKDRKAIFCKYFGQARPLQEAPRQVAALLLQPRLLYQIHRLFAPTQRHRKSTKAPAREFE